MLDVRETLAVMRLAQDHIDAPLIPGVIAHVTGTDTAAVRDLIEQMVMDGLVDLTFRHIFPWDLRSERVPTYRLNHHNVLTLMLDNADQDEQDDEPGDA